MDPVIYIVIFAALWFGNIFCLGRFLSSLRKMVTTVNKEQVNHAVAGKEWLALVILLTTASTVLAIALVANQ